MKDLDFDELDRAVNSLIGATPTTPDAPVADNTSSAPTTPPVVEVPSPVSTPTTPVSSPQPLAARRSSGRFMDVVHPSSDMRSTTNLAPVQTVSREGIALTSRPSIPPVSSPSESNDLPTIINTPPATAPVLDKTTDWPDPLDMDSSSTSPADDAPKETPPVPSELDKEIANALNQSSPLESPFIPDAKVEKRPLGAFSSDNSTTVTSEPTTPASDATVAQTTEATESSDSPDDRQVESEVPLPAELQNDLLSIESNESTSPTTGSTPTLTDSTVSIPQQYTEQPNTGDKPAGAIFDVEAYKKPMAKQGKKKFKWMFIVWIFLLIVVGAGAGAAVYYFVLPSL